MESENENGTRMSVAPATDELNFVALWRVLWRGRLLISLTTIVSVTLFAIYAFNARPVYRAEVLLASNADQIGSLGISGLVSQFSGLASLGGLGLDAQKGAKEIAIATLNSRQFLHGFIERHNLMSILFASRWSVSESKWKDSRWSTPPSLDDGLRLVRANVLSVTEDRRTGLVRLAVQWGDRELAAQWANLLVQEVNDELRLEAVQESQANQRYLRGELVKTDVLELRQAVFGLLETELKKEMIANVRAEYAFKVIDRARPPDAGSYVSPRRMLLIAFGAVVGFLLGTAIVLLRAANAGLRNWPVVT